MTAQTKMADSHKVLYLVKTADSSPKVCRLYLTLSMFCSNASWWRTHVKYKGTNLIVAEGI